MQIVLNDQQQAAVTSNSSINLVVAGAGSGKTRVITSRIQHLIEAHQTTPDSILCLTFTNKAAGEMKERLHKALPDIMKGPFIGTFHAFCLVLMKSYPNFFNSSFLILDEQDQSQLMTRILKQHGLDKEFSARKILSMISKHKNSLNHADLSHHPSAVRELISLYEQEKANNNCLDFDDLLLIVVQKLQTSKEFRQLMQLKFRHILIDEYQDTNAVQHGLIKLLACDQTQKLVVDSVFAVGDQDQSIYSWRGALANNMHDFSQGFGKNCAIFKLEQNYRSVQPILELANVVIKNNAGRLEKQLWSAKSANNRIMLIENYDEYREADLIAQTCKNFFTQPNPDQIAILIRSHSQSRLLEEKLMEWSVAYKIVGSVKFYDRREIRDCLSLLKFCANPADKQSFLRIIGFAVQGLGQTFCDNLFEYVKTTGINDLLKAANEALRTTAFKINKSQVQAIEKLTQIFAGLDRNSSPQHGLEQLLTKSSYEEFLLQEYTAKEAEERTDNVYELLKAAQRFEEKQRNEAYRLDIEPQPNILGYLQEISLLEDHLEDTGTNPVLIMTLHAAKGLEFEHVIIPAVEEGILPSIRAEESVQQVQEECRLLYVGITRAKQHLILTHAQSRNHYGNRLSSQLSRFLDNHPSDLVNSMYCHNAYITGKMLASWLCGQTGSSNTGDLMNKNVYANFIPSKIKNSAQTAPAEPQESPFNKKAPEPTAPKIIPARTAAGTRTFRKGTLVRHDKFGLGVVHAAQKQPDGQLCLTVAFGKNHKKVLSTFLHTVRP